MCQAEFGTELEENDHMVTHVRKETDYYCQMCYNFVKPTTIPYHRCEIQTIKSIRNLIGLNICHNNLTSKMIAQLLSGADNNTTRQNSLRSNLSFATKKILLSHGNMRQEKMICSNDYWSSSRTAESPHFKGTNNMLICPICCKVFCEVINVNNHINDNHVKGSSSFECEVCNNTSYDEQSYLDHLMIHTFEHCVNVKQYNGVKSNLALDYSVNNKISRCTLLTKKKKNTKKLGLKSLLSCKASFSLSRKRYAKSSCRNLLVPIGVKKHVSARVKQNKMVKFNQTNQDRKVRVECEKEYKIQKNKENISGNSARRLTKYSNVNNRSQTLDSNRLKNIIKPCYIPLVSCESIKLIKEIHKTNPNKTEKETHTLQENSSQCQNNQRHGKEDDRIGEVISIEKDISSCHQRSNFQMHSSSEPKPKSGNGNGIVEYDEDENCSGLEDIVISNDSLQFKCCICSEIFDKLETLKSHVFVHI